MKLKGQKKLLENNPCEEDLNKMTFSNYGKFCSNCKANLPDLSELSLKEVVQNHYNKNKCVILANEQIDVLNSFKKLRKYALASSLFIGISFHNLSYSQTIKETKQSTETCLIKGKLIDSNRKPIADRWVYLSIKDSLYETRTLKNGDFVILVPKKSEIEFSNIKKLDSKKVRNRNVINLRKIKLPKRKRPLKSPGFL